MPRILSVLGYNVADLFVAERRLMVAVDFNRLQPTVANGTQVARRVATTEMALRHCPGNTVDSSDSIVALRLGIFVTSHTRVRQQERISHTPD